MSITTQTLRDLRTFLLSDFVHITGAQVTLVNSFVQALINEEQLQISRQAVRDRIAPMSVRAQVQERETALPVETEGTGG